MLLKTLASLDPRTVVILLFVVMVVIVAMLRGLGSHSAGTSKSWPFYVKRVLTPPEQVLYHRLVKSLPNHIVLAQVQGSRLLGVKKGFRFNEWNNRINRLSYDFVVCAKDCSAIAVIELDDKTHERANR